MASQGVEIIRGCFGLNLVGCDLVEVSPPYDTSGNTSCLLRIFSSKCCAQCRLQTSRLASAQAPVAAINNTSVISQAVVLMI